MKKEIDVGAMSHKEWMSFIGKKQKTNGKLFHVCKILLVVFVIVNILRFIPV